MPYRSIDAPLRVAIRTDRLAAFRVGDQVTGAEIAALGDDTLERFASAAAAYVAAHATDYPGFADLREIRWAMRVAPRSTAFARAGRHR